MPLSCNIDARGKVARLVWGILMLVAAALAAIFWAAGSGSWVPWAVVVALGVAGAFGIFEARAGWCVVRAMGFRTPI
jgi:hypothetical protein